MAEPIQDFPIRFGAFEVDPRSGELRKSGSRIRLQDQPLKVLLALLEQPGEVVTREELKSRIWPADSFGDFDHAVNVAVGKLRAALADSADRPRYVETLPRRGYRFIFPVAALSKAPSGELQAESLAEIKSKEKTVRLSVPAKFVATIVALVLLFLVWKHFSHKPNALTAKDSVVLADFTNTTGDPVFDDTLKQALTVALNQSPFLNVLGENKVAATLKLMARPEDSLVTPEVAREVCQRAGSKAYISGSIAGLGSQYVLGLKAIICQSGDMLAQEQTTAASKEKVLESLGRAAGKLRGEVGESLGSLQKFDAPLEEATTESLEALKAYSTGLKVYAQKGDTEAIPFLERAVELDPKFALALGWLGVVYQNRGESALLDP
jgi:DNA-binding winged helix-turn-helix (wHTH) protein